MKAQYFDPHYRHKKGATHQKVHVIQEFCPKFANEVVKTEYMQSKCQNYKAFIVLSQKQDYRLQLA